MSKSLLELSYPFVMDLYRIKARAELRQDAAAVEDLQKKYPELFSADFEIFIENTKEVARHLDAKNGTNFSSTFELEFNEDKRTLN